MNNTKPFKPPVPHCPVCDKSNEVDVIGQRCYCRRCKATFEPDTGDEADDGGDYSDRDPSARIQREERQQAEKQQRRRR